MTMEADLPVFEVILNGSGPYGFRVAGGTDFKMPLRIGVVRDGSKAETAGLQAGQHILRINRQLTSSMDQIVAKGVIKSTKDRLQLTIQGARKLTDTLPSWPWESGVIDNRPSERYGLIPIEEEDEYESTTDSNASSVTVSDSGIADPTQDTEEHLPPIEITTEMVNIKNKPENELENTIQSGLNCSGCGKHMKARDMFVKHEGFSWHAGCLECQICNVPLFSKDYLIRHGQPICLDHANLTVINPDS